MVEVLGGEEAWSPLILRASTPTSPHHRPGRVTGGHEKTAQEGAADPGLGLVFSWACGVALVALATAMSLQRWPGGSGAQRGHRAGSAPPALLPAARNVLAVPGMKVAMLASLTVLTTVDIVAAYLLLHAERSGMSVQLVGFLLAVRAAASIASPLLMLPLLRLAGRTRLLTWSITLPALALAALPLSTSVPYLLGIMLVTRFGLGLGQPITLAWVAARAPVKLRGTAIGVRLTGNRLGQVLLPAGIGVVAGAAGVTAVFPTLSVMLLMSAALVMANCLDDSTDRAGAHLPVTQLGCNSIGQG